jgi:BCD family chlorophyll transporter-like MFS transporter
MTSFDGKTLGWLGIARLGLVQTSLGAIVVLTTSTLNRVMVVELALPAVLPGFLVALHYFVQLSRPRFGYASDTGRRRTPWIIGGMALLGAGGALAAAATAIMATATVPGIALAIIAFVMIGAGVGASGTCLLVLLATGVVPERRAAAASITWIMMIAGFAVTAGVVGALLDPFSFARLISLSSSVSVMALIVTIFALWGLEKRIEPLAATQTPAAPRDASAGTSSFGEALRDVIAEAHTRRFAIFVFVSMLAYSAQDLVLEPFAGAVFNLTPGESTQLGGTQHGGVLLGMLLVAFVGSRFSASRPTILRQCMVAGCIFSAILLAALAVSGYVDGPWPLAANVFALGIANGAFAVAAIGSMMGLVAKGRENRSGMRMGIWGAAQAMAFALGGIVGTLSVDAIRLLTGSALHAYALVFILQAALFAAAVLLAVRVVQQGRMLPASSGPTLETKAS